MSTSKEIFKKNSHSLLLEGHKLLFDNYLVGNTIGNGTYSKVKEGFCLTRKERVAIKIMSKKRLKKIKNGYESALSEVAICQKFLDAPTHSENVIQILDIFKNLDKEKIYIIMEYCDFGLDEVLESMNKDIDYDIYMENSDDTLFVTKGLPLSQCQTYFRQLIDGIKYLHSLQLVHNDIKPSNLLIGKDKKLKISDFGIAKDLSKENGHFYNFPYGSPAFQCPESISPAFVYTDAYSPFKVDIWAAGITLYHMICGGFPFKGNTMLRLFQNIESSDYKMPDHLSSTLQDLLTKLLDKDHEKRPLVAEIIQHPWLNEKLENSNESQLSIASKRTLVSFDSVLSLS